MKKFPQLLFVKREKDTDGSIYFLASLNLQGYEHGDEVAVYKLAINPRRVNKLASLWPVTKGKR